MIEYSLTDNSYRFGKLVLDQNFYISVLQLSGRHHGYVFHSLVVTDKPVVARLPDFGQKLRGFRQHPAVPFA